MRDHFHVARQGFSPSSASWYNVNASGCDSVNWQTATGCKHLAQFRRTALFDHGFPMRSAHFQLSFNFIQALTADRFLAAAIAVA